MEKRKRPKLKTGHLKAGSVFYYYRKPSTQQRTKHKASADGDVRSSTKGKSNKSEER